MPNFATPLACALVSALRLQRRRVRVVMALAFIALLGACATEPVIPPNELSSINQNASVSTVWKKRIGKSKSGVFEALPMGDMIFQASMGGEVVARDKNTGKTLWRRVLEDDLASGVGGADNQVYVATENGDIQSLDASTGEPLWRVSASSEVLTPVSAGFGSLVLRSADGRIQMLDPKTGAERWSVSFTPPALTLNGYSRPLLLDGGVLVGLDDGRLIALNSADGRVLWETILSLPEGRSEVERLVDLDAPIVVDDNSIFAINYQGKLARIEPGKGQILWSVPASSTAGMAIVNNTIVVVDDADELIAFDASNGVPLWTQPLLRGRKLSSPQVAGDGAIVVGDFEGYLHIVDTNTGELIGRKRLTKKAIFPELVLWDNTLYVQSVDGTVAALQVSR